MMTNYRDYFLGSPPTTTEAYMNGYRITLSVERTGEIFMYHTAKRYEEAARLVRSYSKMDGVKVGVDKLA